LVPTMFSLWMDAKFSLMALLGRKPKELNGHGNGSSHGNGNGHGEAVALTSQSRSMNDL
jgi:hypothetical protein